MSAEENKTIARRIPLEAINNKNLALLDEVVDPAGIDHAAPPGTPETFEATKQFLGMLITAFPDLRYTIDQEVAEGDKVVQRVGVSGTMKGDFMGIPATGKHATWSEIHITRFANGKIVEHWANIDQLGMLQQLGVIPMPG
jgi:predicted ester cyclase